MISLENVTFRYRCGTKPILSSVTHDFPDGTLTAVTGVSGGGKSTLLYVLGLLLTPDEGKVSFDDTVTTELPDGERSRVRGERIGFVFQDAVLDPSRTVLDNVLEGALFAGSRRTDAEERARTLLRELGVEHRYDHRPGEISGGQAQRVALCRALVKQPDVVLADEPSGNLDAESAELVWSILRARACAGATVVVATHDSERAGSADLRLEL